MTNLKTSLMGVAMAALFAGPAAAHDCAGQIDEFEQLLDFVAEEAISTSSGGQGVAGAREAQAIEESGAAEEGPGTEEPVIPVQNEGDEALAVQEADDAGDAGGNVIETRVKLQEARQMAEEGQEAACVEALHGLIAQLLAN
ncbi:hypothetical protein FHG66_16200 [Rubellimicrobium rubrum]|uniref:Uncharacterized protein n=1 Tax=Rubellimicrobium rubrum TaxID=2585369 RepID=A0A5C4MP42_9RHOB|nr:hypothetical protein [Rubellimicrobium rubrum]TNC47589.1 hypothetical protein FHG66_16200 [Rubellimicrobium rubrum]